MFFLVKVILSALLIAAVSTVARGRPAFGALIASLPLASVLGMAWLWLETGDRARMERHVGATFRYVIPSMPMFLLIPVLLRTGLSFWLALGCALAVLLYLGTAMPVARFGVRL